MGAQGPDDLEIEEKGTRWGWWVAGGTAAVVTSAVVWGCLFLTRAKHSDSFSDHAAALGDFFGVPAAVFSGLASMLLVIALRMQSQELALQRKELRYTRQELARQAAAQENQVKSMARQEAYARRTVLLQYRPAFSWGCSWNRVQQAWTAVLRPTASMQDVRVIKIDKRLVPHDEGARGHWLADKPQTVSFTGDEAKEPPPFVFMLTFSTLDGRVACQVELDRRTGVLGLNAIDWSMEGVDAPEVVT